MIDKMKNHIHGKYTRCDVVTPYGDKDLGKLGVSYLAYFLTFTWTIIREVYLTHWGRDEMDAISQTTFSSAFSWLKMFEFRLKFHWSLFPRVKLTIFQHWFR